MNVYVGWTFVRGDGSQGYDVVPCNEFHKAMLPNTLLNLYNDVRAASLHVAAVKIGRMMSGTARRSEAA